MFIYGILRKFENSEDFVVEEYDRLKFDQQVYTRNSLFCFVSVDLNTIDTLPIEERKEIFKKIIDIEFNEVLIDDDLRGIFYCIIYWIRKSEPEAFKYNIDILFLSIIKCYYIENDKEKYCKLFEKLEKYENVEPYEKVETKFTHWLIEFQSIYLAFTWLNDLLDRPINLIEPSRFLSGTFIYNVSLELRNKNQSFISELRALEEETELNSKIDQFFKIIEPFEEFQRV